jgi:hypothetical protein
MKNPNFNHLNSKLTAVVYKLKQENPNCLDAILFSDGGTLARLSSLLKEVNLYAGQLNEKYKAEAIRYLRMLELMNSKTQSYPPIPDPTELENMFSDEGPEEGASEEEEYE